MYLHAVLSIYVGFLLSPRAGLVLLLAVLAHWCLAAQRAGRLELPVRELSQGEALAAGARVLARRGGGAPEERSVVIQVDGRKLHGLLAVPGHGNKSDLGVVVTHPWALMGGNLHNNVPAELTRAFAATGHAALRFNFGGFGLSRGAGEVADVQAAVRHLLAAGVGVRRVLLVGYSHGSIVAGAAAGDLEGVAGLVTISPPWPWAWALFLGNAGALFEASRTQKPKLFLLGSWDVFTPPALWRLRLAEMPPPLSAVLVRGCGHFWPGAELSLFGQIVKWAEKAL